MCIFLTFKGLPFGSMKELLSRGENRWRSLTEDCTWATQASPWAPASRGERCWQSEAPWSPDTGITTQLPTGPWAWAFENCRCLVLPPAENTRLWEAVLVFCGVAITSDLLRGVYDLNYSWPSLSMGSASADSTQCGLNIFEKTCSAVADVYYTGPWNMNRLFLSLFPQQYSLMTIYIALSLY